MSTALLIVHTASEGPGRLAEWLPAAGLDLDPVYPYDGMSLPTELRHDALVVLGGPMSADDGAVVTQAELALIAQACAAGRPVLGICLGAQLLAVATGGAVGRGAAGPELGAGLVRKADVAASDPVFSGVPFLPDVVQWHWDEITQLPAGAVLLAAGATYPNQAFRVGETGYGLQFHIETTPEMVMAWALADGYEPASLLAELAEVDLAAHWRPAMERFAELVLPAGRS